MNIAIIIIIMLNYDCTCYRVKKKYNQTRPSSKYDNPNFVRDRHHGEIWKPLMNQTWEKRFQKPFHPAWMDYCDPYHCNDYHRNICGVNRKKMRFKLFQSGCHLILNNLCATYRGSLRYDSVHMNYCTQMIMFLRDGCPSTCPTVLAPKCGVSSIDNHVALFLNECAMERANCRTGILQEYEEVNMRICSFAIDYSK